METIMVYRGYIGIMERRWKLINSILGLYRGYIGLRKFWCSAGQQLAGQIQASRS